MEKDYYTTHFTSLLSLHLSALISQASSFTLPIVPLHIHQQPQLQPQNPSHHSPTTADPHSYTYRLQIPGIREDSPKLNTGDRLVLRGLYPDIKRIGDIAVEAEIVGMVKVAGWVYVRSPHLAGLDSSLPAYQVVVDKGDGKVQAQGEKGKKGKVEWARMYQVMFQIDSSPICAMQDAVSIVAPVHYSRPFNSMGPLLTGGCLRRYRHSAKVLLFRLHLHPPQQGHKQRGGCSRK
jgi:hypothetical protein